MAINDIIKSEGITGRIAEGGDLLGNLALLEDINTWQNSKEFHKAWRVGGIITANMGIYRLVDGEEVFDLLEKQGNLFVDPRFQKAAYDGIWDSKFYFPQEDMKQHVLYAINAKQSVTIPYSGLNVKTECCRPEECFIRTGKRNTDEEKKLFSAVYGTDNPNYGKKVYLLRKKFVKKQLRDRKDDFIARACYFDLDQNFSALVRIFHCYSNAIHGERR